MRAVAIRSARWAALSGSQSWVHFGPMTGPNSPTASGARASRWSAGFAGHWPIDCPCGSDELPL